MTTSVPVDPATATLYPTGKAGVARVWDGHAWSGPAVPDDCSPGFPWHRRPWAVPAHRLFWLTVVGILVGCGFAALFIRTSAVPWLWVAGLVGSGAPMAAFFLYVSRRLRLPQVMGRGPWILWGIVGAAVALPIAYFAEGALPGDGLWAGLAGPIEETGKLVAPVALFLLGRYRDPRAGVALALAVGALFGVAEGVEYVTLSPDLSVRVHHPDPTTQEIRELAPVLMVLQRSFIELLHPMLVAFVAAVAWRSAWVRHRFWVPLLAAWVAAACIHGAIDAAIGARSDLSSVLAGIATIGALVVVALVYPFVFRPAAAQNTPPDALAVTPPPWRPRIPAVR